MVCSAGTMVGKEKIIGNQINKLTVSISMMLFLLSFIYRDYNYNFLFCMGKMEWFYFDLKNPFSPPVGGAGIKLSFFNPFRLSVNAVLYAFIGVVPTLYYKIFKFRQQQDSSVSGMVE